MMMQTENQAKYNEKIEVAADAFYGSIRLVSGVAVVGNQELEALIAAHREDAARNAVLAATLVKDVAHDVLTSLEEVIYGAAFVATLTAQPERIRVARDAGIAAVAAHRVTASYL